MERKVSGLTSGVIGLLGGLGAGGAVVGRDD